LGETDIKDFGVVLAKEATAVLAIEREKEKRASDSLF
jgi:hypothetical protein